jgi:hypothetical protein
MAAQKREAGKNYIGLLSDELEAPYTAASSNDGDRSIRNYVVVREEDPKPLIGNLDLG